ncbi:class I SAM-dependent methyltransferase [Tepidicella baoligensis]|uniref:class I SAM-dependent methyltransferase n=1 Tax=Tepidicella baoligensis TaxID=2707016 RepID=UPI0015D9D500|nr:class I SAM-dependent methyltransferase [Tepidicella baoligensis]
MLHTAQTPSDWVCRWTHLIPDQRPGGPRTLDLACGHGRHTRWLVRQGCHVTALDRDAEALITLADLAPQVRTVCADIESGPWPLAGQRFDAVVVTHYLWRPLWPQILDSLAPEGVLIYETFAHGNASVGKPARPDFLLQPGELLQVCKNLRIVAYEDGFLTAPERYIQRICAVRPSGKEIDPPPRYPLRAAG